MPEEKCPLCGSELCHVTARGDDGEIFLERMICLSCHHHREITGYGSPQHRAMLASIEPV